MHMIISNTLPVYLVVHEDIERLTKLVVSDMRNFFHKIILIFYRIRGSNSCSHTSPTLSNERVLPSRPFPLTPSLSPARCLFLSFRLPHPNFAHSVMGNVSYRWSKFPRSFFTMWLTQSASLYLWPSSIVSKVSIMPQTCNVAHDLSISTF